MKPRMFISLIAVATLLAGCSSLGIDIQNPDYTLRNVQPRVSIAIPFSASAIDLTLNVGIQNPNQIGIRLDRMDFDVLVNGSHLVSGVTNDSVRIPAHGTGDVQIRTRIVYNEARSIFREVVDAIQGRRANYELRGTAYYNTPVGQLQFPVTIYQSGN